ncbi:Multicopper oxidase [Musa troglodytarum]|uniref:Multicopper oxidase n=1 Tax=Musa troglodytarum TaxID=320322 RepID=A0A9E7JAV0_9LILI|nr:Multicopper oxidase [Musa troglodytarum]
MYEYTSATSNPTRLYINRKRFKDPMTKTLKLRSTEVWEVINPTGDNHPLDHLHLATFQAVRARARPLVDLDAFMACMTQKNSAVKFNVQR